MNWYEGGIAEAVALSKKKSAIFVVYIQGNDENSSRVTGVIDDEKVRTKLESDDFVAIKIEAGSLPHQQFTQIYKQASVPSVYFIGKNGAPLEVVTDVASADEFSKKIESLVVKNGKPARETAGFIKAEQKSAEETKPEPNGVCAKPEEPTTSQNSSVDDKVERAKVLLEQTRLLKEKEEEEKERKREIERRKVGQEVQKMKRWQEDQELKQLKEERDRAKREEQAARERVLAQIAQDKADRAARFAPASTPPQSQPSVTQPVRRTTSGNTARLQFKLPDGSTHTHDFSSSDTLEKVRSFIRSQINLPYTDFVLSTTFPRREFNESNNAQSLSDLGLVPNAAILILPVNRGTVSTQTGGGLAAIFWTLISPILGIFNYIKNFFVGTASGNNASVRENKRPAETPSDTSRSATKRRAGESTVVRREGNIHRLSDKTDSDDENNTWNGNSTQQM